MLRCSVEHWFVIKVVLLYSLVDWLVLLCSVVDWLVLLCSFEQLICQAVVAGLVRKCVLDCGPG